MTTDITIPAEAREAVADVLRVNGLRAYEDAIEAACRAMLQAWPGMSQLAENDSASIREMAAIILPLPPQENPNAKA